MRKLIKVLGGIMAIVGLVLLAYSVVNLPKANATAQQLGVCVSNGPQCGTNNGTELVCPEGYSDYQNTCRKFVPAVYSCDFNVKIDNDGPFHVGEFYNKPTGDDNHCHRINWNDLTSSQKNDFKTMDGGNPDVNDYNDDIDQNPTAILQDGTGVYVYADPVSQNCVAGEPRYDSCQQAGTCPTACGQEASQVPDGKGGFISCDATPTCTVDQCINLPGVQDTLPTGVQTNADHVCSCLDGYTQVSDGEDGFTCQPNLSPSPTPSNNGGGNPPTFAGSSTEAPVCGSPATTQLPANVFVVRNGTQATVNGFITQGDSANIYWKESSQSGWTNSSAATDPSGVKPNVDNFVSYQINNLKAGVDYDFGFQQKWGCGTGQLITAVIHDSDGKGVTFRITSWELSQ